MLIYSTLAGVDWRELSRQIKEDVMLSSSWKAHKMAASLSSRAKWYFVIVNFIRLVEIGLTHIAFWLMCFSLASSIHRVEKCRLNMDWTFIAGETNSAEHH